MTDFIIKNGVLKSYVGDDGDVVIPDCVTRIDYTVFLSCKNLVSITIPNSVRSIGDWAFGTCENLTRITISDNVRSIGESAFSGCSNLTTLKRNYKACNIINGKFVCRGAEYRLGKWSEKISNIKPCERGYHFCTNLFNIFNYYCGEIDKDIAIFECEVGDEVITRSDKSVTNKIKLTKRLYREDVIRILNGEEN